MSGGPVIRVRILGCGSSGGVPRIDGDWGECDPGEPKNRRSRCSILVERAETESDLGGERVTRLLVDTSPDLRQQILDAGVTRLDAVAFTHDHADQSHGIDDLRALVYRAGRQLPAWMNPFTDSALMARFGYIFQTPEGSGYPPLLERRVLAEGGGADIDGPGGRLRLQSFTVEHGRAPCSGFRFGPLVYTPDISAMPDAAFQAVDGASVWIVDALREKPHPTHAHLDAALVWLERAAVRQGILTNMHIDLDYRALLARCPQGVRPAYDRLSLVIAENTGDLLRIDPV
ncbi:MBL fold metallo-hydrolase [Glycocaulis profundi]|nr:MBL fold metallo-hydrolase [Glycocaulis profundi]